MTTKTFHHLSRTDEWTDSASWDPAGIPGPNDDVLVPGNPIIDADVGTIASLTTQSTENVDGSVLIKDGGALEVDGTVTDNTAIDLYGYTNGASLTVKGTLDLTGGALVLDSSYGLGNETVTINSFQGSDFNLVLDGGSTVDGSQAEFLVKGSAGFSAPGVLDGTVSLSGNAVIGFEIGQITTVTANAELVIAGSHAFIASTGLVSNNALEGLTSNAGEVALENGASVVTAGDLTNTGDLSLDFNAVGLVFGTLTGGSTLTIGGTLTNTGDASLINIGSDTIVVPTLVEANGLVNTTRIDVAGSAQALAELRIDDAAGFGTVGVLQGDIDLSGDALIDFASGQITSIATDSFLTIDGPNAFVADVSDQSRNSALDGLTSIVGVLALTGGAGATITGPLDVSGGIDLEGGGSLSVQGSLSNSSAILVGAGADTIGSTLSAGDVINSGAIAINADETLETSNASIGGGLSSLIVASLTGGGTVDLYANATLDVGGPGDNAVVFSGTNAVLKLDDPAAGYSGAISGFGSGDQLDLASEAVTIQSYDGTTLVVRSADGPDQTFSLAGPAAGGLIAQSDGVGGTDIVMACYAAGTLIRTPAGDVPVERLAVGDCAITAASCARPIVWIGHRTLDLRRHARPGAVMPVQVAAGAFGEGLPVRDLWLSPRHAIFIDGMLIPIDVLINGTTIRQVERERITYWHVELESHDILLAEGLPAESYLDCGNRSNLDNGGAIVDLHPDFVTNYRDNGCAPWKESGPEVAAVKARILARAEDVGYQRTPRQEFASACRPVPDLVKAA